MYELSHSEPTSSLDTPPGTFELHTEEHPCFGCIDRPRARRLAPSKAADTDTWRSVFAVGQEVWVGP